MPTDEDITFISDNEDAVVASWRPVNEHVREVTGDQKLHDHTNARAFLAFFMF
jgi:hypothetical protein